MKCQFCNKQFKENKIQEHHLHPRFMDNLKGLGMKIYLCEKCHYILHLTIPTIIWKFVPLVVQDDCSNKVTNFTKNKLWGGD